MPLGKTFVQIDLDAKKYNAGIINVKTTTKKKLTEIEQAWKGLGKKSEKTYDDMRIAVNKNYDIIKTHASSTADDIVRAERAKNKKIAGINKQQFGEQKTFIEKAKGYWVALSVAAVAAIVLIQKAITSIIIEIKVWVDLAAKQELAEIRLSSALKATGEYTDALNEKFQEFATWIQSVTKYGDEEVLSMMALMSSLGVTSDKLEEATKMTIGLATATGRNSNSLAMYVALALQGETTMLARYIPALKGVKDETEKMRIVTEAAARGFQMALDQTSTFSISLIQVKGLWSDLKEGLGDFIIKNKLVLDALDKTKKWLIKAKDEVDAYRKANQELIDQKMHEALEWIGNAIERILTVLGGIWKYRTAFWELLKGIPGMGPVLLALEETFIALGKSTKEISEVDLFKKNIAQAENMIGMMEEQKKDALDMTDTAIRGTKMWKENVENLDKEIEYQKKIIVENTKKIAAFNKEGSSKDVEDQTDKTTDAVDKAQKTMEKLVEEYRESEKAIIAVTAARRKEEWMIENLTDAVDAAIELTVESIKENKKQAELYEKGIDGMIAAEKALVVAVDEGIKESVASFKAKQKEREEISDTSIAAQIAAEEALAVAVHEGVTESVTSYKTGAKDRLDAAIKMYEDMEFSGDEYWKAREALIAIQVEAYRIQFKDIEGMEEVLLAWELSEYEKLQKDKLLALDDFFLGMEIGWLDMVEDARSWAEMGKEAVEDFTSSAQTNLSTGLFDFFSGEAGTFKTFFEDWAKDLLKIFTDMISEMIVQWALVKVAGEASITDIWKAYFGTGGTTTTTGTAGTEMIGLTGPATTTALAGGGGTQGTAAGGAAGIAPYAMYAGMAYVAYDTFVTIPGERKKAEKAFKEWWKSLSEPELAATIEANQALLAESTQKTELMTEETWALLAELRGEDLESTKEHYARVNALVKQDQAFQMTVGRENYEHSEKILGDMEKGLDTYIAGGEDAFNAYYLTWKAGMKDLVKEQTGGMDNIEAHQTDAYKKMTETEEKWRDAGLSIVDDFAEGSMDDFDSLVQHMEFGYTDLTGAEKLWADKAIKLVEDFATSGSTDFDSLVTDMLTGYNDLSVTERIWANEAIGLVKKFTTDGDTDFALLIASMKSGYESLSQPGKDWADDAIGHVKDFKKDGGTDFDLLIENMMDGYTDLTGAEKLWADDAIQKVKDFATQADIDLTTIMIDPAIESFTDLSTAFDTDTTDMSRDWQDFVNTAGGGVDIPVTYDISTTGTPPEGGEVASLQHGGILPYTGLFYGHKGEAVVPKGSVKSQEGTRPVHVHLNLDGKEIGLAIVKDGDVVEQMDYQLTKRNKRVYA